MALPRALAGGGMDTTVVELARLPLSSVWSSVSTSGVMPVSPYSISRSRWSGLNITKLRRFWTQPLSNLGWWRRSHAGKTVSARERQGKG